MLHKLGCSPCLLTLGRATDVVCKHAQWLHVRWHTAWRAHGREACLFLKTAGPAGRGRVDRAAGAQHISTQLPPTVLRQFCYTHGSAKAAQLRPLQTCEQDFVTEVATWFHHGCSSQISRGAIATAEGSCNYSTIAKAVHGPVCLEWSGTLLGQHGR